MTKSSISTILLLTALLQPKNAAQGRGLSAGFISNTPNGPLELRSRLLLHRVNHARIHSHPTNGLGCTRRPRRLFHTPRQSANYNARGTAIISSIQQFILKTISQCTEYLKNAVMKLSPLILSLALLLSNPINSWASSSSSGNLLHSSSSTDSSSYYLQNNPQHNNPQQRQQSVLSIQSQTSQPYSSDNEYRYVKRRVSNRNNVSKNQKVKRTTTFVMLATFAASTFRASLRKKRIVRNVSPFGRIRNASALGNGVSVIRVCMALGFDANNNDGDSTSSDDTGDANTLLNRLGLEDKELYTNIAMLAQQQTQLQGTDTYGFRQKALGNYLSNVASTLAPYHTIMRYGSIDSVRVPFVEEAVKEFKRAAIEERKIFNTQKEKQSAAAEQSSSPSTDTSYILATILLAIKGDHTTIPLPFGITRQRDMARALARIATDAKVDDCLVGSEILWTPAGVSLTEKEILQTFPGLVPLT